MATWTSEELDQIGSADELEVTTLRMDGTLRKPVLLWVVRLDDGLYIRSGYGRTAGWFRGTQRRNEGRVKAGGVERDVAFIDADHGLDDKIDAAYRSKYSHHGAHYVALVVTTEARSTTIKIVPQ